MLTSLRVKNLALVEDVAVQFAPGLNMITGETGAGKSILVGALGLVLGDRADKSLIRAGTESCSAEAVFEFSDPEPMQMALEEWGLDPMEDGQLIIRRVIRMSGAAQTTVNDNAVTVQTLKSIGDRLVDMHGPHDHQSLLNTDAQRDILDAFGHLHKPRDIYEQAYERLKAIDRRMADVQSAGGADVAEQMDILSYKVKELEQADLSETEEAEVSQEHAVFGNAQRIMELANLVAAGLTEGDDAAADTLARVIRALDDLEKLLPEASTWREELEEASTRVREVSAALAMRVDRIDADPSRLDWLDQRLTTYQKMKRKYGPTVRDALDELERTRERLTDLQSRDERLAALQRERETVMTELMKAGHALHKARAEAAQKLGHAITEELRALGFTHGQFGVDVVEDEPGPAGLDAVEFAFEPNIGEGMRPLRQIASSGEISRVMLASKAVLARHDRIPVLVFDEIDANIGGETGGAVGRKLAAVAEHHQILCITHLPQVAMYGNIHYAVRKTVQDGRTRTDVVVLDAEQRVEEIARMLGGRTLTELTLNHAREMLKKATIGQRE